MVRCGTAHIDSSKCWCWASGPERARVRSRGKECFEDAKDSLSGLWGVQSRAKKSVAEQTGIVLEAARKEAVVLALASGKRAR